MKIKDVIERTELTDRAIRLYIENGLIAPSCNENYAGRKNIDFSENDVKALNNIATLRKAGFSIAEIKLLKLGDVTCRKTLEEFTAKISQKIESDKAVLEKLEAVAAKETVTIETICESLNSVTEEKAVPGEDTQVRLSTKIIRGIFLSVGSLTLAVTALCYIDLLHYEVRDWIHYLYPRYELSAVTFMFIIPLINILLSLGLILAYRKDKFITLKREKIKGMISLALSALIIWVSFMTFLYTYISNLDCGPSVVVSKTNDIDNYMIFDSEKAENVLAEFLPESIPENRSVEYKYRYQEYGSVPQFPDTEVFLEIWLNEDDFRETVEKYKSFRPADSVCEPEIQLREHDWVIIFYRAEEERGASSNYSPVFAYNEVYHAVRFICEYGNVYNHGAHPRNMVANYDW